MSFEDDMIEEGFSNESDYLDYLLSKEDNIRINDEDSSYDNNEEMAIPDNGRNIRYSLEEYDPSIDLAGPDLILVKRLLHKDTVARAFKIWKARIPDSVADSFISRQEDETTKSLFEGPNSYLDWHSWACANIPDWLSIYYEGLGELFKCAHIYLRISDDRYYESRDILSYKLNNADEFKKAYNELIESKLRELDFHGEEPIFSDGLSKISLDDNIGFIDIDGNIVIQPEYAEAHPFYNGYAAVKFRTGKEDSNGYEIPGRWGFINLRGEVVVPPTYDHIFKFHNGLAKFIIGGKLKFHEYYDDYLGDMSEYSYVGGKQGILRTDGKVVCPPTNKVILSNKNDGVFRILDSKKPTRDSWRLIPNSKLALMEPNGHLLTDFKYTFIGEFHQGEAWFNIGGYVPYDNLSNEENSLEDFCGGSWGVLDFRGNEIVPPKECDDYDVFWNYLNNDFYLDKEFPTIEGFPVSTDGQPVRIGKACYLNDGHYLDSVDEDIQGHFTIPDGVFKIGDNAFSNCKGLISVTIPKTVIEIGDFAFQNCTSLSKIELPSNIVFWGKQVFSGCSSLTSIIIPYSVVSIPMYFFKECSTLKTVFTSKNLKIIEEGAFDGCADLSFLITPRDVKYSRMVYYAGGPKLVLTDIMDAIKQGIITVPSDVMVFC